MKTLFIPVNSKVKIEKSEIFKISKKLPKEIAICYSSQYKKQSEQIKRVLSKNHKITNFIQILGCSKPKISSQAILLVSDGKFHAISLACSTNLPVYIYSSGKLEKIPEKDIEQFKKKKKASYVKFLNAKKIGILVSTKLGQQNLAKALKSKFKNKEKYLFLCNNIDVSQFENFPEIQSWVNTACPRLDMNDLRIVNISELNSRK